MDGEIFEEINFDPGVEELVQEVKLSSSERIPEKVRDMLSEAKSVARPKAMWTQKVIEDRGEDWIRVEAVTLKSRVLKVNLEETVKIFPYAATCGKELEDWASKYEDLMEDKYWANAIEELALRSARRRLDSSFESRLPFEKTATMSPGRIEDWPIEEQKKLFKILDKPEKKIGVSLTSSCLMIPSKSVSGVRFPTEVDFDSCRLCPRDNCHQRKAAYDESLYEERYQKN